MSPVLLFKAKIPAIDSPQWATVSASRKPGRDSSHWFRGRRLNYVSPPPMAGGDEGEGDKTFFVPYINIDTGVRYLALNLQNFGSVKNALIAYNAGPGIAARVNGSNDLRFIPGETKGYLREVYERG